jgi:hypothetical protein
MVLQVGLSDCGDLASLSVDLLLVRNYTVLTLRVFDGDMYVSAGNSICHQY